MARRGFAVGVTTLWAGWWTWFAFAGGIVGEGKREDALRVAGVMALLWVQPLLALRGTKLAGGALLLNAGVLAYAILTYVPAQWAGWLLMAAALPLAVAGLLTAGGRR